MNGLALNGHTFSSLASVGNEELRETIEAVLGICGLGIGLVVGALLGGLLIECLLGGLLDLTVLGVDSSVAVAGATNGDHSAVHVHLAVANLVEPRPSEESITRWCVRGDIKLVLLRNRAVTLDGLNDLEGLTLVIRQGKLA